MICSVCEKEIENGTVICPFCGAFLEKTQGKIIEIGFKKPAPPPVIELSFVTPPAIEPEIEEEIEPEIEAEIEHEIEAEIEPEIEVEIEPEIEAEIEPEAAQPEVEPTFEEPVYIEPAPKKASKKKGKAKKTPKPKKKKSKDRFNFFFFLLSLLYAPYPGIFLWVATSKKAPKSSQVYGITAIVMYLLKLLHKVLAPIVMQILLALTFLVFAIGITVVLFMIQFGYMPMPI